MMNAAPRAGSGDERARASAGPGCTGRLRSVASELELILSAALRTLLHLFLTFQWKNEHLHKKHSTWKTGTAAL